MHTNSPADVLIDLLHDPAFASLLQNTTRRSAYTVSHGVFYPGPPNYHLGVAHVDMGEAPVAGPFSYLKPYSILRKTWRAEVNRKEVF